VGLESWTPSSDGIAEGHAYRQNSCGDPREERAHLLLRHVGANDRYPIEGGLGGDLILEDLELEPLILDGEFEVLGDLVLVDDAPDTHADCVFALDPSGGDARLHLFQPLPVASRSMRRWCARSLASSGLR